MPSDDSGSITHWLVASWRSWGCDLNGEKLEPFLTGLAGARLAARLLGASRPHSSGRSEGAARPRQTLPLDDLTGPRRTAQGGAGHGRGGMPRHRGRHRIR
jgi:hypothetical protein